MQIEIKLSEPLTFRFIDNGEQVGPPISTAGSTLLKILDGTFQKNQYTDPLKDIYVALSRAVEEGDQLMIGIVLGQTLTKLEQIINGN
jgi:hypothetical protein